MDPTFFVIIFLAVASALPDEAADQGVVVDLLKQELVSYPANLEEGQTAEALSIGNTIRRLIEEAMRKIPDPIKFEDQKVFLYFGPDISISGSSRGIYIAGQSDVITDTLNINWLIPLYPRVNFKFIISKIVVNVDLIHKIIKLLGFPLNANIRGQVIIKKTYVQGSATVNIVSKKITNLKTVVNFGCFRSNLEGTVNGVNITSLLDTFVTNTLPQILDNHQDNINDYINQLILNLVNV